MPTFDHYKKYDADASKISAFTIPDLEGKPKLFMKMAGEKNEAYYNALLAETTDKYSRRSLPKMDKDTMEQTREMDRRLYPLHVVVGWEGIKDASGKDVPFSPEACAEFLQAIPNFVLDDIRMHAGNPLNYNAFAADATEVGKK